MITGNETVYPVVEIEDGVSAVSGDERGITIRQYYAGLAMQGLLANNSLKLEYENSTSRYYTDFIALKSVSMADAFIAELNKEQE